MSAGAEQRDRSDVRVLIADDQKIVREGLVTLIGLLPGIRDHTSGGGRRSLATLAALVLGTPLAIGVWRSSKVARSGHPYVRYVSHGVEKVEVLLFCAPLMALVSKLWSYRSERGPAGSTVCRRGTVACRRASQGSLSRMFAVLKDPGGKPTWSAA